MATEQEPVAPVTAVATEQPVVTPQPTLAPITASQVYDPINVQQVLTKSPSSYQNMKVGKLEKQIAKAQSTSEMNQINIKNQPLAMGVITGQQAHQSALDTARINSVTGMYNVKLLDLQRKETERQSFISQYGADPSQRPKGMSKREFSKAIQGGGFQNLLTEDFKQKQLQTAAARESLAGGGTTDSILSSAGANLQRGPGGFVDYAKYSAAKDQAIKTGKITGADFDATYGSMLSPDDINKFNIGLTPSQALAKDKTGSLTSAVKTELATMETVKNLASQLSSQKSLPGVGGYGYGTLSAWAAKNPLASKLGIVSAQGETNRNLIGNIKGTIAKLRGGTSFTPNEEKLLDTYTPGINDSEFQIKTKLQNLIAFIEEKKHQTLLQNGISDPTYGENDVNEILNSLQ